MTIDDLKNRAVTELKCSKYLPKDSEYIQRNRLIISLVDEVKRARILLGATKRLLDKQNDSAFVLDMLSQTVHYDGADCDGGCLLEDIECYFEEYEGEEI